MLRIPTAAAAAVPHSVRRLQRITQVLSAVLFILAACGGHEPAPTEDAQDHHAHAEAPGNHTADAGDDLLHVAPEMLRDLRITTSAVEARPGGDGVTALGEIGVDEERYAEVGSPI